LAGDLSAFTAAALGIALSPLPFLFEVALLGTSRPTWNAVAFVSGEAFAIAAIATGTIVVVSDGDGGTGSLQRPLSALEIVVGALFAVLLAVHLLRPRGEEERPGWASVLDRVGPRGAFAGGLAMVAANPKNLALTLAGAASIAQLGYSVGGQAASVAGFTAVAVSALVGVLVLVVAIPSSGELLARIRQGVFVHERMLVAAVLGALAVFFLLRGSLGTLA